MYRDPAIRSSDITPESVYVNRRALLRGLGALGVGALLSACGVSTSPAQDDQPSPAANAGLRDELGDPANTFAQITNYNNFYEFTTDKEAVARRAANFVTQPWTVEVTGMVRNPRIFAIEDILQMFDQEERIYRLRCVEGWSMVIPWQGFPLHKLLALVEPTAQAQYVRFETLYDSDQMPGQRDRYFPWPYAEGLRIDEAMHDLTILSTGLYGRTLLPQNGAPLRLVVPWKYGFKSIKSIVKIELTDTMPVSLWMAVAPHEYGFYANVNPDVPHPRWSQATERRIGEMGRRKTLPFNGYAEQVAVLYAGMDLRKHY
ncbi:mononuclear molybdenum enzyme YedY [Chloroflexus islandicus]|uniref:Protein-methionine-sulfoxide reductase catalytic subunit MsrP n=1 Tax=Chloroflexus islandicus TaxID=1707952 RepID=A0A178ME27_9CHLR|nr:protein-methionine-sulfoxide reductase catalytic subunit MsrP [Chloroflexus islandicus]OAN46104.1 mononuclear molybdenum enzyme YedY [Chloroflexus islandicus]